MLDWKPEIRARLAGLKLDPSREAEIVEELAQHLEDRYAELRAAGKAADAARLSALEELSDGELLARGLRLVEKKAPNEPAVFGERNRSLLGDLVKDLRYALRMMRKNLGFTTVAVLTLTLGIGAAAAVFGLIHGVLLSPPPYGRPDQLVLISPARLDGKALNQGCLVGQWMEWRGATQSLAGVAAYAWTFSFLVTPDGSESIEGMVVTKDYLKLLGLKPVLGRDFVDSDVGAPGSPLTTIILGYDLWRRKFNSDPNIVGKTVRLSRIDPALVVIGVMPQGVRYLPDPNSSSEPNYDLNSRVDYWLPATPDVSRPKSGSWNLVARLRDGASVTGAQAEIAAIAARQARSDSDLEGITASVRPLGDDLNREGKRLLVPLSGAVVLVFLIACGNVTGLLLARGLQRQGEYAMRSALGAGRGRMFRQVLTESLMLALAGALAGAALAAGIVRLIKAVAGTAVPRLDGVTVGWPVWIFGVSAAVVAAALAGLLPAVRAARRNPYEALKGARSSAGRAVRRLLGGVAVVQTALTLALLVSAALLIRTLNNLARVRPGYETGNVLTMSVTCMKSDQWKEFHRLALERVSALPGVRQAAFVWGLPLTGNKWFGDWEIVGESDSSKLKDRLTLPCRAVTEDYFDLLAIKVKDGRGFRSSDTPEAPIIAVVNEALVSRYFPNLNPIGRKLRVAGTTNTLEIVGVVSNTRTEALSAQAEPEVYFSLWQNTAFSKHLIVHTSSDPAPLIAMVRHALHEIDPTAAVEHFKTMEEIRDESVAPRTFAMRLLVGFSVVASLLALVGIYGVLSLSVGSRLKEIAVRVAVGAQQREILALVLGEGLRLIALGLTLGALVTLSLGRAIRTFLFGVNLTDPLTFGAMALMFAAVALIACYIPAHRASKVDPILALRNE